MSSPGVDDPLPLDRAVSFVMADGSVYADRTILATHDDFYEVEQRIEADENGDGAGRYHEFIRRDRVRVVSWIDYD